MTQLQIKPYTEEWFEFRKDKIGASDIPYILCLSEYDTPFQHWQKRIGFKEKFVSNAMKKGHDQELRIRNKIIRETGNDWIEVVCQHHEYDWAYASLDCYCPKTGEAMEVKSTSILERFKAVQDDNIPPDWLAQIWWQCFVESLPGSFLHVVYNKNDIWQETRAYVKSNDAFIEEHLTEIMDWRHCLITMTPPAKTETDYQFVDNEKLFELEKAYIYHDGLEREEASIKKSIRDQMLELLDDGNCVGKQLKFTRVNRDGSYDYKKLIEDLKIPQETLDKYKKESIGFYSIKRLSN